MQRNASAIGSLYKREGTNAKHLAPAHKVDDNSHAVVGRLHPVVRHGLIIGGYLGEMLRCSFGPSCHLLIPLTIIPE